MINAKNPVIIENPKNQKTAHPKNFLNDLNGSEWKFATKSVIFKPYPVNMQHKLRSKHGGQKPPQLCADLIKIFTKKGETVLDPLAGVGGTLLGASLCNREAIGIEINKQWERVYSTVCNLEKIKKHKFYIGDANKILSELKKNSADFILTDVPYWNMDQLRQTRSSRTKRSKLSKFNNQKEQTKEEWLMGMKSIFEKSQPILRENKYMGVFIGDMYRGKEYHILSADLANTISSIPGWKLKANIIWLDNSKSLHIYGYPHAFIPSLIHQYILIFKKELN